MRLGVPRQPAMGQTKKKASAETTRVSRQAGEPSLPEDKVVSLTVTAGPRQGKVFPLTKSRVVLGRSPANDIVLDDPAASRVHCLVEIHGSTALLRDLESSNGTFVEDEKIKTFQLSPLAEFRIGETTLMFMVREKEE